MSTTLPLQLVCDLTGHKRKEIFIKPCYSYTILALILGATYIGGKGQEYEGARRQQLLTCGTVGKILNALGSFPDL